MKSVHGTAFCDSKQLISFPTLVLNLSTQYGYVVFDILFRHIMQNCSHFSDMLTLPYYLFSLFYFLYKYEVSFVISAVNNETEIPTPAQTCPASGNCEHNVSSENYYKGKNPCSLKLSFYFETSVC